MNSRFLLSPLLAPASWLYFLGLQIDRALKSRRSVSLAKPVLSTGNLTWGGTGKTPLLLKLISDLTSQNHVPAILTRGYPHSSSSDEVRLMTRRFPQVPLGVGADRVESAKKILGASSVDVLILDDGFQHWRIQRKLDIVCVDATDPWGGGHLIPWGRLREPVRALERAQVIVITRCELVSEEALSALTNAIQRSTPKASIIPSRFVHHLLSWSGNIVDLPGTLRNSNVVAISAIGNPQSFEDNLKSYGAKVHPVRFADHYPYTDRDLDRLEKIARENNASLVVTEKDEIKLRETRWGQSQNYPSNLFVLRAELRFSYDDDARWKKVIGDAASS